MVEIVLYYSSEKNCKIATIAFPVDFMEISEWGKRSPFADWFYVATAFEIWIIVSTLKVLSLGGRVITT